jgi:flagellar hook-length control protein FliK
MTELASISTVTAEIGARRRQSPMRGEAPFFNYAMAAASLEQNAAKSLEAHGAKPANPGGAAKQATGASSGKEMPPGADQQAEITPAKSEGAPNAPSAARQDTGIQRKSSAANAAPLPPPAAPSASSSASLASTKPLEAAALRENAAVRKSTLALKAAARQPAEPASVKAEFAQILAKRLEKTSVFDIRLDPPDLGRVEGRLAIGDDGKAVLSLAFDNQNAFDLFSRDEQALRQALVHAGLDFGAGDFAFSFREPAQTQALLMPSAPAPETQGAYDPVFRADWSAGALDIRI